VLSLVRLNYHLSGMFDAGLEYRWLTNMLTHEVSHGALVELAWRPMEQVALGIGYNFSRFSDDLLADPNLNQHGFFLRATGSF